MFSSFAVLAAISLQQQETPTGVGAPAGARIETLGETMQVERTRLYRVQAVAEACDVSAATIYRAVESGALRAKRMGTGKGAIRISGEAIEEYLAACESAAATRVSPQDESSGEFEFAAGGAA
ncbi:helix-turn-helix domain-containing protein [Amycolatopsis sp. WAC 04169]|uniref:helix-turn-helix domain-containing protein n=1 Tax=Amycolatopsis sp. WAC 04169 TaxID=2203197 RepID=UPI001F21BD51|nr:helix-turn-helix domain-containing protein [Amycolatopsis sp. WAC 04169]